MLGLRKNCVELYDHDPAWEIEAEKCIETLKNVLKDRIVDIQHVGSTAIPTIKAKPIIDIAVGVKRLDEVRAFEDLLRPYGFYYLQAEDEGTQILFAKGSLYDGSGELQTHFIHFVEYGNLVWLNYLNFRTYLRAEPDIAKEYEKIKLEILNNPSTSEGRREYTIRKADFIQSTLRKSFAYSFLGRCVTVLIDRPLGSSHPKYADMVYEVNYGYLESYFSLDGEEVDVYLLGVDRPVESFEAEIIGVIYRKNDVEDKLVAAPCGMRFSVEDIEKATYFQEKFFETEIKALPIKEKKT